MDKIIDILLEIEPNLDVKGHAFITDHHLDSLSILSLVAELEDEFDIMIPALEITEDNLNSVESIYMLVNRLQEEDL